MCSSSFFRYLKVADVIQYRSLSLFMPEFHFVCFFSCEHYVLALFRIMFPLLRRLMSFLIYNNVCFFFVLPVINKVSGRNLWLKTKSVL